MRIVLIGASGMVGQGVLRACMAADDVGEIIVIARRPLDGYHHPRLQVIVDPDMQDFVAAAPCLSAVDACFFCAGVSAFGMDEAAYRKVTLDLTLRIASQLLALNPNMAMVYVSGAGADRSEQGKRMWARVRGQTENALERLAFSRLAIFRPGAIIAESGIQSRTAFYRWSYLILRPLLQVLAGIVPEHILTTRLIGQAMLNFARRDDAPTILHSREIRRLAQGS